MTTENTVPAAWTDLIEGLTLLSRGASNAVSPLHCEHDQLTVMADPELLTAAEIGRLVELGFNPSVGEETFYSFRFGSA